MTDPMNTPLVSILMGVYYRRPDCGLLKRSVQSILAQTMPDFELLVCDDGSLPGAKAWLEHMATQDARIRLIRKGNLLSLAAKLNACLRQAQGEWIARMDDDDFSHPERLDRQLSYLKTHSELAFAGCCVNLWRDGEVVGRRALPEYPRVRDFYMTQPFIHPSLVFRREALITVGGYSEDQCCMLCEDYDLLLRLYAAGYRGGNLQEVFLTYTVPASAKGNRRMRHRWNEMVTRCRRFQELGLLPQALPFVIKPMMVGLLPERALRKIKERR